MGLVNVVLFAALCALVIAEVTVIDKCPDTPAGVCEVSEARITPCKTGKKCALIKGKDTSLSFDFTPNFVAQKLKTGVYWANGAIDLPFKDLGSDDACSYTTCPSEAEKKQTLDYSLHVGKKLPTGTYPLKWKVWNEENSDQVCCFMTTIKIKKR